MAVEALSRNHDVTIFHRGVSPATVLDGADFIHGDRDQDLAGLAAGSWDATIDVCGYRPHQIDLLADTLDGRGGQHTFISTVSVYADDIAPGGDESSPLVSLDALAGLDPVTCDITGATYGPLKVMAEQRVHARYDDPLVIRPTYIIGPYDHTMRFPTWVERIAHGGVVDIPAASHVAVQYIDAADQARFVIDQLEAAVTGTFTTAAPPIPFIQMLNTLADTIGGPSLRLQPVEASLADAESGRFLLWTGPEPEGVLQMSTAAAVSRGLTIRPLAQTARATLEWLNSRDA